MCFKWQPVVALSLVLSSGLSGAALAQNGPAPQHKLTPAEGTEIRTGNAPKDPTGRSQVGEGVFGMSPNSPTTPPSTLSASQQPCEVATALSERSIERCQKSGQSLPAKSR